MPAATTAGTVAALTRHPVKSVRGEALAEARVDHRGVEGDRVWAVCTEDGGIGSGKTSTRFRRVEGLLACAAAGWPDPVLTLPDGTSLPVADAAEALSAALGRPLRLQQEDGTPHHDDCPVHLITTAGLRALEELVGDPVDPRRFRATVVVDVPGVGFPEDAWLGRQLQVGDVVLAVDAPMPRCVMVTMAQGPAAAPASAAAPHGAAAGDDDGGLLRDERVLEVLARHRGAAFGVMARVVRPGTIRVGDAAIPLP